MSDFLSSLRAIGRRSFVGDGGATDRGNAEVRASPQYRQAASNRISEPQGFGGFTIQDSYSPVADAAQGRANQVFAFDMAPDKNVGQQAWDTAVDVTTGFVGGALNLAALAGSGVSAYQRATGQPTYDLGVPIGQFADSTTSFLSGLRTDEAENASQAYSTTAELLQGDNRQVELEAVAAGGNPWVEGAKRIGADVWDTGRNLLTQPEALGSGVSQGVGSLLLGGPVAKGATAAVSAGARALTARGLMSPRMATAVAESMERAAMTGTIASMEAGGAYTQASNQVMSMSHEQLMEDSPQYAGLIASGMSPDRAKNQIASRAGSVAAVIQAPIAAATGRMVARFEGAPLAAGGVRDALRNIGTETIEEGVQSATGGLSSNLGIRFSADEDADLGAGVGSGLAEGAIFGSGTAGALVSAGAAANGPGQIARGVVDTVGRISERGRQINEANSFNPAKTNQAVKRAVQPAAVAPVAGSAIDPAQDQAEIDANRPLIDQIGSRFQVDPATYQPYSQTEVDLINNLFAQNTEQGVDIWDVMRAASDRILDKSTSPEEKVDMAQLIDRLRSDVTEQDYQMVSELQSRITPGGTVAKDLDRIIQGQEAIANNPLIEKVLQTALSAAPEVTLEAVEDVSTPEGERAARQAGMQATVAPETLPAEVAERLLRHSANRPDLFSRGQLVALRSSVALNQSLKRAEEQAAAMGAQAPVAARVAANIQTDDYLTGKGSSKATGPSVRAHFDLITSQLKRGFTEEAQASMEDFRGFAQHMANKITALNASFNDRSGPKNPTVMFDTYSPSSKSWVKDGNGVYVARFSIPSITTGQQIGVDGEYVIDTYNALARQNPELGAQQIEPARLDAGLKMPAQQVLERAKAEQRGETVTETVTPAVEQSQQKQPEPKTEEAPPVEEEQLELPLSRVSLEEARGLKDGELNGRIALIADRIGGTTEQASDKATLAVLRSERDARQEALLTEPSTIIEDTAAPVQAVEEVAEPEAKPEAQATEETAAVEEKKTPSIEEVFPSVIRDTNGDQLLLNGFTLDNENRTKLMGENYITIGDVIEALQDPEAFEELSGISKTKLTPGVTQAYNVTLSAVSTQVWGKMMERLASSSNFAPFMKGADPTNAIRRVNLRLLNIMERNSDGSLSIQPLIGEAMMLAMTDWLAQNSVRGPQRSEEDIARKLKINIADVDQELVAAYNGGVNSQQAHETLANTIGQFLGLKSKKDVKNGLTEGLLLSMAGELLDSAEEAGLVKATPVTVNNQRMFFLNTETEALGLKPMDQGGPAFGSQSRLISQMILQDAAVAGYTVGEPSGNRLTTLQGGGAPITAAQQVAARNENAVPQTVNRPMLDLFRHLGMEGVVDLFGNGSLPETLNKHDKASKEGQNLSFGGAYETMMGLVQELEAAASEGQIPLEEVKLYREYAFTSVNRMQQQGQHGDQASKLTREMITPYATTLDMTNPEDASMWRRGIAQAMGIKIEKLSPTVWEADLQAQLERPEIRAAVEALKNPQATAAGELIAVLKDAGVEAPVQLHALRSIAEFEQSTDKENFYTHVYVEADGVTDGPTNSLIYMRKGGFDAEMVRGLARGGFVFAARPTALHEIFNPDGQPQRLDTYEIGAQRLADRLTSTISTVVQQGRDTKAQNQLRQVSGDLLTVMRGLLGSEAGFTFSGSAEDGYTFSIKRKQLKNPLTVTVYGSSPSGIAAKIAHEMVRTLYAEVSEANRLRVEYKDADAKNWPGYAFGGGEAAVELLSALSRLGKSEVVTYTDRDDNKTYSFVKENQNAVTKNFADPVEFTVTKEAMNSLTKALETFYVGPMVQAINEGMGSSVDGSELIQRTTNFLSAMAKNAMQGSIERRLNELVSAKKQSMADGLSPEELQDILKEVAFLFPYMSDDSVTVNVKGLSKALMDDKPGSEKESAVRPAGTFKDNIHAKLSVAMPTVAGVAGAAYVNISYGDGRMIIQASPNMVGGRLMVFDGINLDLKNAKKNGEAINKTVLEAIQTGTPFQDLMDTFGKAVDTIGLDAFASADLDSVVKDLTPATFVLDQPAKDWIEGQMVGLKAELSEAVLDEKARQAVLQRVHMSSDHMAALATPASTGQDQSREDLAGLTEEEQAARLEALFREERAKLVGKQNAVAALVEDLRAAFEGLPADESGARVTTTKRLRGLLNGLNLPNVQRQIINRALTALEGTDWTVVMATPDQATAYAKKHGIPFSFGEGDFGLAAPARKTIIVVNASSETLAHELVHAATLDRVAAYYADQFSVDEVSRDAIRRLDALMIEWLGSAYEASALRNKDIRDAVMSVTRTVTDLINNGKSAEALNEFMAWSLTNQALNKFNSTIKVESKLARIARSAVNLLRKMFGLPAVGADMASNIRFNSMVLMSEGLPSVQSIVADRIMMHASKVRADLTEIARKFAMMVRTADTGFEKFYGPQPSELALRYGYNLAQIVSENGFKLTNDELQAFVQVVAAYRADRVNDTKSAIQLDAYYREVLAQLNQSNMMDDPGSQDPDQQNIASLRMRLLNGSLDVGSDIQGRSLLLPMFVALGATSSQAQRLFNRIEVRNRKAAAPGTTVDAWIKSKAGQAVDRLMDVTYGTRPNQRVSEEVQKIVAGLVQKYDAEKGLWMQTLETPSNMVRELNEKATDVAADLVDLTTDGLEYLIKQAQGTPLESFATTAGKIGQGALGVMSKRKVDESTTKLTGILNSLNMPQEFRAFASELMGVTGENVDILKLVKIARASIHRVRQTYRVLMPSQIAEEFTRKLSDKEWADIHEGFGKTGIFSLLGQGLSSGAVIDLLNSPLEVSRLRDQKLADIRRLFGADAPAILGDASDLATTMLAGRPAHGFIRRNALAIANRAGEDVVGSYAQDSAHVQAVDAYVSLLALSQLPEVTMKSLSSLAATERKGMTFTLSLIAQAHQNEMDRVPDRLRYNVPKGYMPYEKKGQFKAVSAQALNEYTKTGYRVVGSRKKGNLESLYDGRSPERIYVATDLSAPPFKQGIMQTVRSTVFGLDAATGLQHDNPTGGMISDPTAVKRITAALKKNKTAEPLLPMFNEQGQIYAYERVIDQAEIKNAIETQNNAAVSIGHWMGRQHEEHQADALNDVLVSLLADRWEAGQRQGRQDEFIDLFEAAATDPVIDDAMKLISNRDQGRIRTRMGDKFMVERSLYEQVIGYRSISVGDLWTGNSRIGQEHRDSLANFLTGMFGAETYRRLTVAERGWSNLMGDARVAIVVKSVLVPVINGVANFFQLMANGIGPVDIAKKSAEKLRETHLYAQNHLKYQELENRLAAAKGEKRPDRVRLIETEMRKIEDLNKRLSIWPLIQAGEFTQVTEGLTDDDMELTKGRIWDHVSKLADRLPPAVKTAGRYAVIAKDTALFEGLARTVSYTDFVAKAVLYDHLMTKNKLSATDAHLRITNEFVNYDLLGGRMRSKAEEVGLIWFWAFKVRSIKVAMSMIRNNPLHALLTGFMPGVDQVGTVIDDNMLSLFMDGRWDNSLGPDNALRALSLNPVAQVL